MPQEYDITVNYDEESLSATITCPLCENDWKFPFPAREISGKPWPDPVTIVNFHLYLYGAGEFPTPCAGFDPGSHVPCVEAMNDVNVKLRLVPNEPLNAQE